MNDDIRTGHVSWSPDYNANPAPLKLERHSPSNAAACCDSLTASEWLRLSAWFAAKLKGQQAKPAIIEFTAGACRDAATAFEQAFRHNAQGEPQPPTAGVVDRKSA